jgi:type IV secretion system protein VirB6
MPQPFITPLLANVDAQVEAYARAAFGAVGGAIAPAVLTGGALILAWWGVLYASGRAQAPLPEFTERIAKVAVFAGLVAGTAGTFDILYGWFNAVPEGVGQALLAGENPAAALDRFYASGLDLAQTLMSMFELSGTGLTWLVLGVVVWIACALLAGFGAFLIVLAKVSIAVLLAVAPIFIFLAMFQTTRSWFEGWLRGVLTQAMVLALTYGFLAFLLFVTADFVAAIETAEASGAAITFDQVGATVLVVIVGVLLLAQVPTLASAVGGGAAVGTMGAWGAAWSWAGGRLGAAASHAHIPALSFGAGRFQVRTPAMDAGLAYQRMRNAFGGRPAAGARDDWARPVRRDEWRRRQASGGGTSAPDQVKAGEG